MGKDYSTLGPQAAAAAAADERRTQVGTAEGARVNLPGQLRGAIAFAIGDVELAKPATTSLGTLSTSASYVLAEVVLDLLRDEGWCPGVWDER